MPNVTISAFDKQHLPSPLMLKVWQEDWSLSGGTWAGPAAVPGHDNQVRYTVAGRTTQQVEATVDPTIESYNKTHHGNDTISASVS